MHRERSRSPRRTKSAHGELDTDRDGVELYKCGICLEEFTFAVSLREGRCFRRWNGMAVRSQPVSRPVCSTIRQPPRIRGPPPLAADTAVAFVGLFALFSRVCGSGRTPARIYACDPWMCVLLLGSPAFTAIQTQTHLRKCQRSTCAFRAGMHVFARVVPTILCAGLVPSAGAMWSGRTSPT